MPKAFVFVSADMFAGYHREWREIGKRFPHFTEAPDGMALDEHWTNVAMLRAAARQELQEALRYAAAHGYSGSYPVAV